MSYPERYCPACGARVSKWEFVAPPDHYRCLVCLEATPFKDLPERQIHWSGGPFAPAPTPIPPTPAFISPYQRFYFPGDGGVPGFLSSINPTVAAWDDTSQASHRPGNPWRMLTAKSAAFNVYRNEAFNATVGVANLKTLLLAYVSNPLEAGTISGTVKGQIQWLQDFADCAQDRVTIALSVVSSDGLVNRGYLLPLGVYGTTNLFQASPNPQQNRFIANGDAMTPVDAEEGDMLFLEIGSQPSTAPVLGDFVSAYVGGQSPSDLPEDETSTLEYSPWLELIP